MELGRVRLDEARLPGGAVEVRVGLGGFGADAPAPGFEFAAQGRDAGRLGGGEVGLLARILGEVVELEAAVFVLFDEFSVALADHAHGPAALVYVAGMEIGREALRRRM